MKISIGYETITYTISITASCPFVTVTGFSNSCSDSNQVRIAERKCSVSIESSSVRELIGAEHSMRFLIGVTARTHSVYKESSFVPC